MRIVVLGAAGKTGREVTAQALAAGHDVVAFARTAGQSAGAGTVSASGDATNAADLQAAFHDADAVISTLGGRSSTLIADSTRAIIEAAHATGVKRVTVLSSFLVQRARLSAPAKAMSVTVMGKMIADKAAGEATLRNSDLDWRIVYATALTDGEQTGSAHPAPADTKLGMKSKISRRDVAQWLLAVNADDRYSRSELTIEG